MKKFIILIIFSLPFCLFAGDYNLTAKGAAGSITLNDEIYNKIALSPEFSVWKFALGLNIELLFDKDGNIYEEDWDEAEDYVNKILYLRYAQKGDPFYFLFGNINSYTLGKGLIMKNYTNTLLYPDNRKLGAMVGFNVKNWSVELFSADVIENDIVATRVGYSPLSRLQIGVSAAADLDQYNGIVDQDGDGYPDIYDDYPSDDSYYDKYQKEKSRLKDAWTGTDSEFEEYFKKLIASQNHKTVNDLRNGASSDEAIYEIGADYTVDIYRGRSLFVQHYGEVAHIVDHGYGFVFPGFIAKFFIFDLNVGFRHYEDEFTAPYFGNLYDQNRIKLYKSGDSVLVKTKEDELKNAKTANGWQGTLTSDIYGIADLIISYSSMYYDDEAMKDDNYQGFEGMFSLRSDIVPFVSTAYVKYSQENEPNLFSEWQTENTYIEGKIGVELSSSTAVNWIYTERYKDLDGNGKINGSNETISNVSFGVEMTF